MSEEQYVSMSVSRDSDEGALDGNMVLDLCKVSNGVRRCVWVCANPCVVWWCHLTYCCLVMVYSALALQIHLLMPINPRHPKANV